MMVIMFAVASCSIEVAELETHLGGSCPVLFSLKKMPAEGMGYRHNTPSPAVTLNCAYPPILFYPRYLYHCKDVALRRNAAGSLGFCIVGGYEEHSGNKPFFIKSVVEGTPAYNDGRIRCGDILLAVNGRSTAGMTHACLARMLKELKGRITLTLVSWPGTFL